jgi:hypothetical protein
MNATFLLQLLGISFASANVKINKIGYVPDAPVIGFRF